MNELSLHLLKALTARENSKKYQKVADEHKARADQHLAAAQRYLEEGNDEGVNRETDLADEALQDAYEWIMRASIEHDVMAECIAKAKGDKASNVQSPDKPKTD